VKESLRVLAAIPMYYLPMLCKKTSKDYKLAYEVVRKCNRQRRFFTNRKSRSPGRIALPLLILNINYTPLMSIKITVSRTLEYVYNDLRLSIGKSFGSKEEVKMFKDRSFIKIFWDTNLKLMRGKNANGT
jgi:putative alpha-1,2-mannosidase